MLLFLSFLKLIKADRGKSAPRFSIVRTVRALINLNRDRGGLSLLFGPPPLYSLEAMNNE